MSSAFHPARRRTDTRTYLDRISHKGYDQIER